MRQVQITTLMFLLIASVTGTARLQQTEIPAPTAAPIAFYTPRSASEIAGVGDLIILDPISRSERRFDLEDGTSEPTRLAWSPDYSEIAVSHMPVNSQYYSVVVYGVAYGDFRARAETSGKDSFAGRYSAEGGMLFFTRGAPTDQPYASELHILISAKSVRAEFLVNEMIISDAFWSPVDNILAATGVETTSSNAETELQGDIFLIDPATKRTVNLTQTSFTEYVTGWSPDGSKIAYISDETGKQEAYIMDADGRNKRQISQHPHTADDAHWTRDGQHLVYLARDTVAKPSRPFQPSQLVLHDLETGEEQVLVEKKFITRFDLSPDSDQLAYISHIADDAPFQLCVLDLNTREEWCAEHEALSASDIAWGID